MYYYVLNPAAGRGGVGQIEQRLRARLKELGIDGEFAKTTGPGDASKLTYAAVARGFKTIVAVGGDGTVNEVINGIKKDGVAVGIVPLGKGNTLAKKLGVYNWQQAAELLASRRLTSFNLMAAGSQYFLSNLTIGFGADWDKQVDADPSGLGGRVKQLRQSLRHAKNFEEFHAKLQVDDNLRIDAKVFYLWITNQKFLNPAAPNKLIISFSDRPTRRQLGNAILSRLSNRAQPEENFTSRLLADRVVIETKPEASLMIDSKLSGRTPIAVRLTEKKIRFICGRELAERTGLTSKGRI